MLTKRTNFLIAASLLLIFLLGLIGGLSLKTILLRPADEKPEHARRTVWVAVDRSQWHLLFDQFRKFADKWRYAIRIAPLDPGEDRFIVDMWRADMRVTAFLDDIYDPGMVQIHFYDTDPDDPNPDSYFDEEISDLRIFISQIPNTTFTEER